MDTDYSSEFSFDENSEFIYPRESMIKSSDGQWSDDFVMRVVEIGTSTLMNSLDKQLLDKHLVQLRLFLHLLSLRVEQLLSQNSI